jgi:hypothetical protein
MKMPDGTEQSVLHLFQLQGRRALITGGAKDWGA